MLPDTLLELDLELARPTVRAEVERLRDLAAAGAKAVEMLAEVRVEVKLGQRRGTPVDAFKRIAELLGEGI